MSFELPSPKTRKEYYMAIAAGGVPGTDFPARYEVAPVVEHVYHKYEKTLTGTTTESGYIYSAAISDFVNPENFVMTVKINGKDATGDPLAGAWTNVDGYYLQYNPKGIARWSVGITSETELSGDALNVVVECYWDDNSDTGTPLQPKTVEEAYYANLAEINVATALASMPVKTRKDQYLNAIINNAFFDCPSPKTRKEYYMAIAAGGEPGKSFPARYEVAPVVEHVYHKYEETLEVVEGYIYVAPISDFINPGDFIMTVKINGKDATFDQLEQTWTNADGYYLQYIAKNQIWAVVIESETELSGAALNVTVETFWDDDSDAGTPLQPKTVEEAYYANLAQIDVTTVLASMPVKTRKDQYLNAIITAD